MDTNIVNDITEIYFNQIVGEQLDEEVVSEESDEKRKVIVTRAKRIKDIKDKKAALAHLQKHAKLQKAGLADEVEFEGDLVDEGSVADRARSAVANQRLDDEQSDTQDSVERLRRGGNRKVTRASASIAASKSKATVRGMHPPAGKTGAYRIGEANDGNLANNYPPYDKVTRGDVIAGALGKDQMGGKKKKKVQEGNDGNLANNYPPYDKVTRGDVIAGALGKDQMGGKKKKKIKEGFSNWREDLIEVADKIGKNKSEEPKIVEKAVNNKIDINPKLDLGEAAQNLGGSLLEMVKIEDFEGVLDELTESEVFLLKDDLIEQIVEEVFVECIQEGYDLTDIENTLLESLEISSFILNEETDADNTIREGRLEKVKSAVKSVAKGLARGVGYAAGAAVRAVKGAGREMKSGYKRGRQGSSSSQQSSSGSGESGESKDSGETKKPGLLSRIGSKLKRGLKKVIHRGASAVEKAAGKVASRTAEKKESPKAAPKKAEKAEDPWAGSATTPPKAKTNKKVKSTNPAAKGAAKEGKNVKSSAKPATTHQRKKRTSKLDSLLASVRADESVNLVGEKVVNPYAVGMAVAMKSTGDKPPLKKSTIMKAHKIAKKVETKEEAIREALHAKMIEKIEEQFGI